MKKKPKAPSKGVLDRLWREAAIETWGNKCEVCGSSQINVHHIFTRANRAVRWDVENACILCPLHHTFDSKFSAHGAPAAFYSWLMDRRGEIWWKSLKDKANKIHKWTRDELIALKKELST